MINRRQLYQDFQTAFPIESLSKMPLEKYTNLKREDSFCYWLESRTDKLGSIWGGSSYKFGIFEYQKKPGSNTKYTHDEKYAWYASYNTENAQETFKIVRDSLVKIAFYAKDHKFVEIESMSEFGNVFKWKIAFLYSNECLIPIYKQEMLAELASHFGMKNADKANYVELQTFLIQQKGDKDLYVFYEELLTLLEEKIHNPKYWIYSPGEKASRWDWCLHEGKMCIGYEDIGDLEQYHNSSEIVKQLQIINNTKQSYKNDSLALWEFAHEMKPGDIVYAKKGVSLIIGRGIVKDVYCFDDSLKDYQHIRKVDWTNVGEWPAIGQNVMKTLTDITKYPDYVNELEALFSNKLYTVSVQKNNKHYWWLVASPKIWQFSDIDVDAEIGYTLFNDSGNKRRIFQNFQDAKAGDMVIGYEANPVKQIVAIAEISKEADGKQLYFKKKESLIYPINYSDLKELPELANMQFFENKNGSFFKLTEDEYNTICDIIREQNPLLENNAYEPYTESDFLNEVFIETEDYHKLHSLLLNKQNVILQGAPGVGKTFSAKRLAYSIMGKKDTTKIEVIQFHQNYSYEDFIMGYRPTDQGGFELKRGIFYNFCKRAQNDPKNHYFFIIDEINRGNLSKIFGEILMLIEKDYRGQGNEITLAYTDERFYVPKNLYLIGMMNTADRSLAMIDYALRRRFSFFEMKPGFSSNGFKKYFEHSENEKFVALIEGIKALNSVIEKDDSLGAGFCIGHSYFCNRNNTEDINWLSNIVEFDICPMLREYWFDNNERYQNEASKLMNILK